jgi:YhfZ C-terminal domain/Helix-turn-helix domain
MPVRAHSDVTARLARQFIGLEPGLRLPTIRDFGDRMNTSISSVHKAITRLDTAGAIRVERRGRQGSYLAERSLGLLWAVAVEGPLVVALPLASSRRYEALATAIKGRVAGAGIEVFLIFVRGSRRRLDAVRRGRCHLAVVSAFAASELCGEEETKFLELPPDTFNTGHRVFYSATHPRRGRLRVLVDRNSVDQERITLLEFDGTDVEYVSARHDEFPSLLEVGRGDVAVWTPDEMEDCRPSGVFDRPLSGRVLERIGDSDRCAALVGRSVDSDILLPVVRAIDPVEVQRTQAEVLARRRVPEY